MKRKVFTERDRKDADGPYMDNPEHLKTDKESIYDMHEDMQHVDPIPLEDLKMEEREKKIITQQNKTLQVKRNIQDLNYKSCVKFTKCENDTTFFNSFNQFSNTILSLYFYNR